MRENERKFEMLRQLQLPLGHYAVTGSGSIGVRNLREVGDIDLIVSQELWSTLATRYAVIEENGVTKITLTDEIEAFRQGSFPDSQPDAPSVAQRISQAEIINGLPFESLAHVLYYKRQMGREKDLRDIALIEAWLDKH